MLKTLEKGGFTASASICRRDAVVCLSVCLCVCVSRIHAGKGKGRGSGGRQVRPLLAFLGVCMSFSFPRNTTIHKLCLCAKCLCVFVCVCMDECM